MLSSGALLMAGAALLFLVLSGLWAERRFASYARLPLHYGPTLRPTRMGSRGVAIWLPTGIMASVIVLNIVVVIALDSDQVNGDPDFGVTLGSLIIAAAQVFILWLHSRWARGIG